MTINELKFQEFFEKLEGAISSVIIEIDQDELNNWDEDYITLDILKELRRNFRQVIIKYSKNKFIKIRTNFLKFNKKLNSEEKYGDIAILIKLSYDDGIVVEGVGLIEAKKLHLYDNIFSAIKIKQLETIYNNAPHAYLMLYDYKRIDDDENFKNYLQTKKTQFSTLLYAALVPIDLARQVNSFNRKLYRFSTAFSYQFAYRYIYGLDLEFSDEIIQAAKGYQVDERYPPQYVIQVSVKHTRSRYDQETDLTLPEVNLENFTEINNDNIS